MNSFIKIIEIWTPSTTRSELNLTQGLYGNYSELRIESEYFKFALGEGLPGHCWLSAQPQIISLLEESYFLRSEIVNRAGLQTAFAIPIFTGEFLQAVVLFMCGDKEQFGGAIELWKQQGQQLHYQQGCYGNGLDKLAKQAPDSCFATRDNLIGEAWQQHLPMTVADLSSSSLCQQHHQLAPLHSALALPLYLPSGEFVINLLANSENAIMQRSELWLPDSEHMQLYFHDGFCSQGSDLQQLHKDRSIRRGEGVIGKCWLHGKPIINKRPLAEGLIESSANNQIDAVLALPLIEKGELTAVMVWML